MSGAHDSDSGSGRLSSGAVVVRDSQKRADRKKEKDESNDWRHSPKNKYVFFCWKLLFGAGSGASRVQTLSLPFLESSWRR